MRQDLGDDLECMVTRRRFGLCHTDHGMLVIVYFGCTGNACNTYCLLEKPMYFCNLWICTAWIIFFCRIRITFCYLEFWNLWCYIVVTVDMFLKDVFVSVCYRVSSLSLNSVLNSVFLHHLTSLLFQINWGNQTLTRTCCSHCTTSTRTPTPYPPASMAPNRCLQQQWTCPPQQGRQDVEVLDLVSPLHQGRQQLCLASRLHH